MGTKMERGIQAELGRALMLLATGGCKRERSVHNLYLRKLTGSGVGKMDRGKTGRHQKSCVESDQCPRM